jgi:hypothetical protein
MADLAAWWRSLSEQRQRELFPLETGDVLPADLVETVAAIGQAVGSTWEGQRSYTFTVSVELGRFLASVRGVCSIDGCGQPAVALVELSGSDTALIDAAGNDFLTGVDRARFTLRAPLCSDHIGKAH